jgi:hypothetical protein
MSKLTSRSLCSFTLLVLFAVPALAQDTHNVWSTRPLSLIDGATSVHYSTFVSGNASFAWTQMTTRGYAHVVAVVPPALKYDFMLVTVPSSNADGINGRWDIRRNGVLVCNNCIGKAYALSSPIGNYFKIYVGTPVAYAEKWHYSGYVTNRFDF